MFWLDFYFDLLVVGCQVVVYFSYQFCWGGLDVDVDVGFDLGFGIVDCLGQRLVGLLGKEVLQGVVDGGVGYFVVVDVGKQGVIVIGMGQGCF